MHFNTIFKKSVNEKPESFQPANMSQAFQLLIKKTLNQSVSKIFIQFWQKCQPRVLL